MVEEPGNAFLNRSDPDLVFTGMAADRQLA